MAATGGSGRVTGVEMPSRHLAPAITVTPSDCSTARPPWAVVSVLERGREVWRCPTGEISALVFN